MATNNASTDLPSIDALDFDSKTDRLLKLFELIRKGSENAFMEELSKYSPEQIDISAKDAGGNSIIFDAATRGYTKALELILKYTPRLDVLDTEGYSLLYYPIKQNDIDIIELLLNSDKDLIGTSLTDIVDRGKYVPLFYAVKFNNITAMKLLIESGANVNYRSDKHNTTLHMAVIRGYTNMVKLLLENHANVNVRSNDGSTPLSHACSFDRYEIAQLLLEYGADPNLIEFEHEFSPLFYSIEHNNVPLTKLLIESKADPNHQDYLGNTVLTYLIHKQRYELLDTIFSSYPVAKRNLNVFTEDINKPVTCQCIDPTIVNMDGYTIGHLLIYFYQEHYDKYLKIVLPKSNLNYQDNQGNTILLLLLRFDLWRTFSDILVNKKLNLFIRNNENKTPYDYDHSDALIRLVISSYQNYLLAYPNQWTTDWENNCTDCKDKIKDQILVNKISVPVKKDKIPIVVEKQSNVSFSTFTGSILDVVVGFRYLADKYNCTSLFTSHRNMSSMYMKQLGIVEDDRKAVMAIEIMWVYQKIFLPPEFSKTLSSALSYEYIIIPIGIVLSNGAHSNCLIYHVKTKVLERFEPHGSKYPLRLNYNPDQLDSILYKVFTNTLSSIYNEPTKITYYPPASYLPKVGFQRLEGQEATVNMNIGDPNGFCSLWCIFYLDYRLKYANMNPRKLVRKLIAYLSVNHMSFRSTIRNYSKRITDLRDQYLDKLGYDINDYLNKRLTIDDLDKLNAMLQQRHSSAN